VKGWELVPNTARLCIMNLYLHGIDADPCPIKSGVDSLASDPGERFSVVLTNPPFGKKSSISIVNEAGDLEKDDILAQEIADDLQTALEQFTAIAEKVKG
jgi:type I restriction enzyme M protein